MLFRIPRRTLAFMLPALGLAAALTVLAPQAHAAQTLRIASNFPSDHTASQAMTLFKTEVEQATKGELKIALFPDMQLGGAMENVDQVRSGTIFASVSSIAYYTRIVPEFEAVSLPFLFDSRTAAFRVMDGEAGKLLDQKMAEKGFIVLGTGELGFRHATNNVRPLASAKDFAGLKFRLQPNEVHLATFKALGANPVSMDVKEVYSALQQGVLDGQENPYNIIATRRFSEVQKYLSDTAHFFDYINVVANKRQFERLPADQQQAVRDAMAKAMQWQRAEAEKLDTHWREQLIKGGMQFTEITPETREELRKATASVVDLLRTRVDPKFVDLVVAEGTAK
ncbi:TRAP transporter substrate-binding protein [Castellaniella hirudinis]|uniref:TRAP transporter substrate-binding protein n=1 Tax=Castellaniella hirudinis TaxID=1144617 RepID=A0ABV8S3Q0_9BURK